MIFKDVLSHNVVTQGVDSDIVPVLNRTCNEVNCLRILLSLSSGLKFESWSMILSRCKC